MRAPPLRRVEKLEPWNPLGMTQNNKESMSSEMNCRVQRLNTEDRIK